MLVLTRRVEESIRIGENIEIKVLAVKGKSVKIGIKAPWKSPSFGKRLRLRCHNRRWCNCVLLHRGIARVNVRFSAVARPRRPLLPAAGDRVQVRQGRPAPALRTSSQISLTALNSGSTTYRHEEVEDRPLGNGPFDGQSQRLSHDAPLAADPFEVADQQHAEVNARRNPRPPDRVGVMLAAQRFRCRVRVFQQTTGLDRSLWHVRAA